MDLHIVGHTESTCIYKVYIDKTMEVSLHTSIKSCWCGDLSLCDSKYFDETQRPFPSLLFKMCNSNAVLVITFDLEY